MSEGGGESTRSRHGDISSIGQIDEIVATVLFKLPVKCLLVFKSFAKFWLKLISQPHFAKLHLSCSRKNMKYLICPYPDSMKYLVSPPCRNANVPSTLYVMKGKGEVDQTLSLPLLDNISLGEIMCFSNGLLCCTNVENNDVDIQICNPSTREVILLPRGSPSTGFPSVGFTFDPEGNNYRVFRFYSDSESLARDTFKCEVYASDIGAWRGIAEVSEHPDGLRFCGFLPPYACTNGRMYWIVWSEDDNEVPDYLFSIDMNDNIKRIELPKVASDLTFLVELEGFLSLVQAADTESYMNIWELEDHDRSVWSIRMQSQIPCESFVYVNSVAARDRELFFIFKDYYWTDYYYYILNLADNTWKNLNVGDMFKGHHPVAFTFAESLLRCDAGR